ncbi:MAG TPA: hypothetical protein VGK74_02450 [Symbiobacteriaceae bacterium]|jgi:DNA-binding MarR family transcriptional regulator
MSWERVLRGRLRVTATEELILVHLYRHGTTTTAQLAPATGKESSGIRSMGRRLESKGYVASQSGTTCNDPIAWTITEAGRDTAKQLLAHAAD